MTVKTCSTIRTPHLSLKHLHSPWSLTLMEGQLALSRYGWVTMGAEDFVAKVKIHCFEPDQEKTF